ncbi:bro18 [Heliothis virescens ascovirus 3i]|nr:bro18 [Heliothis virescens ascovirus 3i]
MSLLTKRSYSIGKKSCDVWIVEIPRKDKEPMLMVSAHGIAELLGYKRPRKAVYDHIKHTHRKTWGQIKTQLSEPGLEIPPNWQPNTVFITEPAIYKLCNKSQLPESETLQDWIYDEVLPEMRRAGRLIVDYTKYATDNQNADKQDSVGYVYVASTQAYRSKGVYKIGSTKHPETRLSSMNSSHLPDDRLTYDALYQLKRAHCQLEVETAIHETLSRYRVSSDCEFFRLEGVDYRTVIQRIVQEFDSKPDSNGENSRLATCLQVFQSNANSATTRFSTNALLAKDNITDDEELRINLESDRIPHELPNRSDKREVLMLEEYMNDAHQTVIRVKFLTRPTTTVVR